MSVAWIRTIEWADAEGTLKAAYDWQAASLGEPAEFTQVGSLYPEIVEERLRLYKTVEACPSGLDDVERQLACYVTSLLNGTAHCASGLRLKLASLGVAEATLAAIEADPAGAPGPTERATAIMRHAAKLTTRPTAMLQADVEVLRAHGLDDLQVLDVNNLVAYYNYINRIVMGLGIRSTMGTVHEATKALPGER